MRETKDPLSEKWLRLHPGLLTLRSFYRKTFKDW
jgi:hypothetical protein